MHPTLRPLFPLTMAVMLACPAALRAQGPSDIGTTAAAVNAVKGTVDSRDRALKAGDRVFQREVIATAVDAKAQLVFRDETSLTVGPGSSVTLDSFVYDPGRGASTSTLNAARGVFRFVSGNMPSQSYQVRTPAGSIGVRGTTFELFIGLDGALTLYCTEGSIVFTMRSGQVVTVPAGSVLEIAPDGTTKLTTSLSSEQYRRLAPLRAFVQRRDGIDYLLDDGDLFRDLRRRRIRPGPGGGGYSGGGGSYL